MQFLESTLFGVRSAVWTLKSKDFKPIITLFPMLHIGDESFYSDVKLRAADLDIVLTEGVNSKTSRLITFSYRTVLKNPRLGLVLQPKLTAKDIKGKIIHADVSPKEFESKWRKIPFFSRLRLSVLFPFYGFYIRRFATRERIAKNLNTEISLSRRDLLDDDEDWEEARGVLVDWRDTNLLRILDETLDTHKMKTVNIGIVYGAGHMRAVMTFLNERYNYYVTGSEWLDVIKL